MKFSDIGIIISQKNYNENSLILKIFSREHGIYRGFIKSAKSKKSQAIFQVGNLVSFEWRSRIEDALGNFYYLDLEKSFVSRIIFDNLRLNCCSTLFSIFNDHFQERENHEELFDDLYIFLQKITNEVDRKIFLADYIRLEISILRNLGYGIDLSSCVVTNSTENLAFVSPKSARAVCFEAGKNYETKLLKLPKFLLSKSNEIENFHLSEGLKLSGYFLQKFIFSQGEWGLSKPKSRSIIEAEVNYIC